MSDETQVQEQPNIDEVQPVNPVDETQNVSRETIPQRPENVPEKFWNAETGQVRTDDLLKSNAHLEQFVGGKKEELRDEIINELSDEAIAEAPETYEWAELPENITVEEAQDSEIGKWWVDHCKENAYSQEEFQRGINAYFDHVYSQTPNADEEFAKLGENGEARLDAIEKWLDVAYAPDTTEYLIKRLGQDSVGVEFLETLMENNKQSIGSQQQYQPSQQLTIEQVRAKMRDPRYYDSRHRDPAYVKEVDADFNRLYRGK